MPLLSNLVLPKKTLWVTKYYSYCFSTEFAKKDKYVRLLELKFELELLVWNMDFYYIDRLYSSSKGMNKS